MSEIYYAEYIMQMKREKLGLDLNDKSKDDLIIKDLQKGEKISKSKHLNGKNNLTSQENDKYGI